MSLRGKSINLFLMDGDVTGRIKCTLANWTGIAYKIPRSFLEKCKDRDDLKQSGAYMLFGISEESGKNLVYIGQAGARKNGEGILNRLQEHKKNPEKDYWNEAIVFTTANNSFGPTEISYLEHRFCNMALETNRYDVKNGNDPSIGNVTEEKESELEDFIDYAKIVIGTLGHKVFVPLVKKNEEMESEHQDNFKERTLFLKRHSRKSNQDIEATCRQTGEGFVVLKGSRIEIIDSEKIPVTICNMRKNAKIDENNILQEDILFNSPSYAAAFVIGGHINGPAYWKDETGKALKDLE